MSSIHVGRRQIAEKRDWQPQGDVDYGVQKVEQDATTGAMTIVTAVPQGIPLKISGKCFHRSIGFGLNTAEVTLLQYLVEKLEAEGELYLATAEAS